MGRNKFAIIGSPIDHSLSPFIHQEFAAQTDIDLTYEKIELSSEEFLKSMIFLKNSGYRGLKVTAPLKKLAFNEAEEIKDRARHAGAINTITFDEYGMIIGDNTDGIGFIRDLKNNAISIANSKILIMGAGGAARGIIRPLFGFSPKKIIIANRTKPKALELIDYFKSWGKIKYQPYEKLKRANFDIIINATSAGFTNEIPALPEGFNFKNTICYDVNYAEAAKPFLHFAKSNGAHVTIDGLGMLVEQAAESFFQWHDKRPDTLPIIKKLHAKIREELSV